VFLSFLVMPLMTSAASAEDLSSVARVKTWTGDLDGMEKRRVVRILVPYSKTIYFIDKGRELGTAVELGQAFEDWLNKRLKKAKAIERIRVRSTWWTMVRSALRGCWRGSRCRHYSKP
jgi:hypothetical protein